MWLIHMRGKTHSYEPILFLMRTAWIKTRSHLWHDSFLYGAWLVHMCCTTPRHSYEPIQLAFLMHAAWIIPICGMTASYVCVRDSSVCVAWLIHWHMGPFNFHFCCAPPESWRISTCDMTRFYVGRDSFVVWYDSFIRADSISDARRLMTHSYAWHDSFICVTWLICMVWFLFLMRAAWELWRITMRDMTRVYVWRDSYAWCDWFIWAHSISDARRTHSLRSGTWLILMQRLLLQCVAMCCSVLQCVAVCCSVLQCVAVCCSVLQCVAVLHPLITTWDVTHPSAKAIATVCWLQYVAACCSML